MLVQIQQTKVLAGDGTQTDLTPQAPNLISMNIDVYPIQNLAPSLPPHNYVLWFCTQENWNMTAPYWICLSF